MFFIFLLSKTSFEPSFKVSSTVILDLSNMGGLGTIIEIAVAAVVYFVVLIIFNTFEPDDVLSLPKGEKLLNLLTNLKIIR